MGRRAAASRCRRLLPAALAVLFAAAPSAAHAATWALQSPAVPQVANGELSAVNCTSSTACTAVGSFTDSAGFTATFAERWNGTSWTRQTTANPSGATSSDLDGVRCPTTTTCFAVGMSGTSPESSATLIERWNGTSWSVQASPDPAGAASSRLAAVTCTSTTSCFAVGSFDRAGTEPGGGVAPMMLVERWNGAQWSVDAVPAPTDAARSFLNGISCTTSSACTAVGVFTTASDGNDRPFAARWNGTAWSTEEIAKPPTAEGAELTAVSCPSPTACTAVGDYFFNAGDGGAAWAARWNGTTWSVQPTPDIEGEHEALSGVSCTATTACTAVGTSRPTTGGRATLAERWNGTAWSVQTTPNRSGTRFDQLSGVSCGSATACITAGSSFNVETATVPLAEGWNGGTWSIRTTPNPSGAADSTLAGVRCTASTACTAVGSFTNGAGVQAVLAERWTGTAWSLQAAPTPSGATASLFNDVTCTSGTACTAVGTFTTNAGTFALAERWNGTSWSIQAVPTPAGAAASELEAVSCPSSTACTAVGSFFPDGSGTDLTFAVRWNGTSWSVQSTPNPTGVGDRLTGVSCPSTTACTAVGATNDLNGSAFAERWNGATWSIQPTPAGHGLFASVSCPSAGVCTAVGGTTEGDPEGRFRTFAARWDGTTWLQQPTATVSGTLGSTFEAVTCPSAGVCVAVGSSIDANDREVTLAQRWTGTWAIEPTPEPGALHSRLEAVSCAPGGAVCFAVGHAVRTVHVPVVERAA